MYPTQLFNHQVLDLSGNDLQTLPREIFAKRGLVNLQRLHLSNCNLGQVDPTAFRGLTNLVELNLAGNLLTSVPIATFAGEKRIRDLVGDDGPFSGLSKDKRTLLLAQLL